MSDDLRATRSARIRRRPGRGPLAALAVAGLVAAAATATLAAPRQAQATTGNTYVALGDSYSSGEGAPPLTASCDQSPQSWVAQFASGFLGQDVPWTNDACSGATSADVVSQGQLNALGPDTRVVTITAGGNDLDFGPAVESCVTGSGCLGLTPNGNEFDIVGENLHNLYQQIVARAPNATLLVVSYPDIWPPGNQTCLNTGLMSSDDILHLHQDVASLNQAIQDATAGVPRTIFVDSNAGSPFAGHDVCANMGFRAFNGVIDAAIQGHAASAFHPDSYGYALMAVGVAQSAIHYGIIGDCGLNPCGSGGGGGGGGGGSGGPSPGPGPPPGPGPGPGPEPSPSVSSTIIYGPPGG